MNESADGKRTTSAETGDDRSPIPAGRTQASEMSLDRVLVPIECGPELCRRLAETLTATKMRVLSFRSVRRFLDVHDRSGTACIVLDASTRDDNGLDIQRKLASEGVTSPTIVLVARGDVPTAVQAMQAGASHVLETPLIEEAVLSKIQECLARVDERARMEPHDVESLASLTPRERQILDLVVTGKASKRIAYELGISVKTVEKHRENMMRKAGAENVADLVRIVLSSRNDPLPPGDPPLGG